MSEPFQFAWRLRIFFMCLREIIRNYSPIQCREEIVVYQRRQGACLCVFACVWFRWQRLIWSGWLGIDVLWNGGWVWTHGSVSLGLCARYCIWRNTYELCFPTGSLAQHTKTLLWVGWLPTHQLLDIFQLEPVKPVSAPVGVRSCRSVILSLPLSVLIWGRITSKNLWTTSVFIFTTKQNFKIAYKGTESAGMPLYHRREWSHICWQFFMNVLFSFHCL